MQSIKTWAQSQEPRLIADLSSLVRIRSISQAQEGPHPYGEGCAHVLDAALALAQGYGLETENHEYYCGSVLLRGETNKELAIATHLDVVPENTGWYNPPYEPYVKDGWLYGRGSADNKGASVASLYVLRYFREHNIRLRHTLRLIYGCAEETGMSDMVYYLDHHAAPSFVLVPDAGLPAVYAEKAGFNAIFSCPISRNLVSFDAGSSTDCLPAHACAVLSGVSLHKAQAALCGMAHITVSAHDKGVQVSAEGVTAHAAFPERGRSAAATLAQALINADLCTDEVQSVLAFIAAFEAYDGSRLGIACADELSGALSIAGTLIRTQDGQLIHHMNARGPVTIPPESVYETLCTSAAALGFKPVSRSFRKGSFVSPEHPVIPLLTRYAQEAHGIPMEPYTMGGGTYARMFPNAIASGFGLPKQKKPCPHGHGGGHQPDECVSLTNLKNGIAIYAKTLMDLDKLLD